MSFDIFLGCYRNGEPATFKRSAFNEIFDVKTDERDPGYEVVEYPDGSGGAVYLHERGKDEIEHMMFNHCGGDTFWAKVYELLYVTQSLIYWPSDGSGYAVASTAALKHLPADLVEEAGKVKIVHNARELEDLIYS